MPCGRAFCIAQERFLANFASRARTLTYYYASGVIHVLAVEAHDIVKHTPCLYRRAVGIQFLSLDVVVDGIAPSAMPTGLIAQTVVFIGSHAD